MRNCIFIFLFIFFALAVDAQTVRNVKATQEGQKIVISYELVCSQPTEINLFLSEDNGKTWNAVKTGVSGDVGSKIIQGSKVIYWDVLQSKEKLVGNAFVFKVKVGEGYKLEDLYGTYSCCEETQGLCNNPASRNVIKRFTLISNGSGIATDGNNKTFNFKWKFVKESSNPIQGMEEILGVNYHSYFKDGELHLGKYCKKMN
jgi:hypothetical protein